MDLSERKNNFVSPAEMQKQREYVSLVRTIVGARYPDGAPKAFVHTYGCQGNVADSERIKGQLKQMGYVFTETPEDADFVLFNTCAVREHAEDRVFGNVGALKPIKEQRRGMIIALCGCMMQQPHVAERIRRSYPYVNLLFGTYAIYRFAELMYKVLSGGKRVFETTENETDIAEGIPVCSDGVFKRWLPVMYGCNNFCTYCVVPYVRGRERSRKAADIIEEAKRLVAEGAVEITLLGQNVNSYGKTNDENVNFAKLLKMINDIPGDFKIRFMTSHPKDCTKELLDTMASCEKVCRHLHLPVQSGSNRVLREMNRCYTREKYLELVDYARTVMPDISLTSDIIVGFPGETYEEFLETVSLVEQVKYTSLFTFIYSPRVGTKAASMPDPADAKTKSKWFSELLKAQEKIACERSRSMLGGVYEVLVEEETKPGSGIFTGRTGGNINIDFPGDESLIGKYINIKVTEAKNWVLSGRIEE